MPVSMGRSGSAEATTSMRIASFSSLQDYHLAQDSCERIEGRSGLPDEMVHMLEEAEKFALQLDLALSKIVMSCDVLG